MLTLAAFVLMLPTYAGFLQTLCSGSDCLAGRLHAATLPQPGISVDTSTISSLIFTFVSVSMCLSVAAVIFWRKPDDWMALLAALMLVLMATGSVTYSLMQSPSPWQLPVLSTGVFVLYADDQSFTFMTPEGHMFASWITLSAYTDEDCTVIQVHLLLRANDPLYEMGMLLRVIPLIENRFWSDTLTALMAHFHASAPVCISSTCIDPQRQWSQVTNIWKNAAIRTVLSVLLATLRWLRDGVRKQTQKAE